MIDGVNCEECVMDGGDVVELPWDLISGSDDNAVGVVVNFGGDGDGDGGVALMGRVEKDSWEKKEKERQAFNADDIVFEACAVNETVVDMVNNVTNFMDKLEAGGLKGRMEFAFGGAVLEALNASISRCEGREGGTIDELPEQPKDWDDRGYKMVYNQSEVESYFEDVWGRVWRGMVGQIATYERDNADDEEVAVLELFWGGGVGAVGEILATRKKDRIMAMIEAKEVELKKLYSEL